LAYFLCDWSAGFCTAEDVLKGLIVQTIEQEESLAQHGRWFVPSGRKNGIMQNHRSRLDAPDTSGSKATTTVDNLWKCLQDMLEDPIVNSYQIVISNIHCLEATDSTQALLVKIAENALVASQQSAFPRRVKWMITSRREDHIEPYLRHNGITIIDMENDSEYGGKITHSRQRYASEAVARLRESAGYGTDLAFYIRNIIETQSRDETWTDVLCLLLKNLLADLPSQRSDLVIRKWLQEEGRRDTRKLIETTWNKVGSSAMTFLLFKP
jgi:hypothetical protein